MFSFKRGSGTGVTTEQIAEIAANTAKVGLTAVQTKSILDSQVSRNTLLLPVSSPIISFSAEYGYETNGNKVTALKETYDRLIITEGTDNKRPELKKDDRGVSYIDFDNTVTGSGLGLTTGVNMRIGGDAGNTTSFIFVFIPTVSNAQCQFRIHGGNRQLQMYAMQTADGQLKIDCGSYQNSRTTVTTTNLELLKVNAIIYIRDGNTAKIYVNGVLATTDTSVTDNLPTTDADASLELGRYSPAEWQSDVNFYCLHIFDRALNDQERKNLIDWSVEKYAVGTVPTASGLSPSQAAEIVINTAKIGITTEQTEQLASAPEAWIDSVTYAVGATVFHSKKVYYAKVASTNKAPDSNATEWHLITGVMTKAEVEALAINYNSLSDNPAPEKWLAATAYTIGKTVFSNGSIYHCLVANTNKEPSANATEWKPVNGTGISTEQEQAIVDNTTVTTSMQSCTRPIPVTGAGVQYIVDLSNVVMDSDNFVSGLVDAKNGALINQGVANRRPVFRLDGNKKPYLEMAPTQFLQAPSVSGSEVVDSSGTKTSFMFVAKDKYKDNKTTFFWGAGGANKRFTLLLNYNRTNKILIDHGTGSSGRWDKDNTAFGEDELHALFYERDGDTAEVWVDGVSEGSQSVSSTLDSTHAGAFSVGSDHTSLNYNDEMDFNAMIIWNRVLTDEEKQMMFKWASEEFGSPAPPVVSSGITQTERDAIELNTRKTGIVTTQADQITASTAHLASAPEAWIDSVTYAVGATVFHNKKVYYAKVASTNKAPDSNATEWHLITGVMTKAEVEALAINYNSLSDNPAPEKWLAATAYTIGKTVFSNGSIYHCLVANTNKEPSANATEWKPVNGAGISTAQEAKLQGIEDEATKGADVTNSPEIKKLYQKTNAFSVPVDNPAISFSSDYGITKTDDGKVSGFKERSGKFELVQTDNTDRPDLKIDAKGNEYIDFLGEDHGDGLGVLTGVEMMLGGSTGKTTSFFCVFVPVVDSSQALFVITTTQNRLLMYPMQSAGGKITIDCGTYSDGRTVIATSGLVVGQVNSVLFVRDNNDTKTWVNGVLAHTETGTITGTLPIVATDGMMDLGRYSPGEWESSADFYCLHIYDKVLTTAEQNALIAWGVKTFDVGKVPEENAVGTTQAEKDAIALNTAKTGISSTQTAQLLSAPEKWLPATNYAVGVTVFIGNKIYYCVTANINKTPASNAEWRLITGSMTKAELEGVGISYDSLSGTTAPKKWLATTAYTVGKTVFVDEKIFYCIVANSNKAPATNATEWRPIDGSGSGGSGITAEQASAIEANTTITTSMQSCTRPIPVAGAGVQYIADLANVVMDSDNNVSALVDAKNGAMLNQGTENRRPVFKLDGNKKPYLEMAPTQFLQAPSVSGSEITNTAGNITSFMFVGKDKYKDNKTTFFWGAGGANKRFTMLLNYNATNRIIIDHGTGASGRWDKDNTAFDEDELHALFYERNGDTAEVWVDGNSEGAQSVSSTLDSTHSGAFAVGSDHTSLQYNDELDFSAFIIWNRVLTDAEKLEMFKWASEEFGSPSPPVTGITPEQASAITANTDQLSAAPPKWSSTVAYVTGQAVFHNNKIYYSEGGGTNRVPGATGVGNIWREIDGEVVNDYKGGWQSGVSYPVDAIVSRNNEEYRVIQITVADPIGDFASTAWRKVSGGSFRGNWNTNQHYYIGDSVNRNGAEFRCTGDVQGSDPTSNAGANFWMKTSGARYFSAGSSVAAWYHQGDVVRVAGKYYMWCGASTSTTASEAATNTRWVEQ